MNRLSSCLVLLDVVNDGLPFLLSFAFLVNSNADSYFLILVVCAVLCLLLFLFHFVFPVTNSFLFLHFLSCDQRIVPAKS